MLIMPRLRAAFVVALLTLLLVAACDLGRLEPATPPEVRVGFVFERDKGSPEGYGYQMDGVQLALSELSATGDEPRIVPVYGATSGDPAAAQELFASFVRESKVHAILGPTLSSEARLAHPVAQQAGVPVLAVSNTAGGISDVGDYIFRLSLSEGEVIVETVKRAKEELDLSRVSLVYTSADAYSKAGADVYRAELGRRDVEIIGEHTFKRGETYFEPLLKEIAAQEPEAIVISALEADAWRILEQARGTDVLSTSVYFIGGSAYASPRMLEQHRASANNLVFSAPWHPMSADETSRAFVESYRETYNREPDLVAAQAYAGVYILHAALIRADVAGKSLADARNAIRDSLRSGSAVPTTLGPLTFTDRRNPTHPPSVMLVRDGRVEELR